MLKVRSYDKTIGTSFIIHRKSTQNENQQEVVSWSSIDSSCEHVFVTNSSKSRICSARERRAPGERQ